MEEQQGQRAEGQVEKATGKGNGKAPAKTAIPEPAPMEIEEASHPKAEDKSKQSQGTQEVDLEEKRRLECLDNMEKIEKEFSILKEKFYSDKIAHLKAEIDKILEGKHEKYLQKLKDLEKRKEEKIWAAEQWKQYQLMNINNVFEAEKKMADDEFQAEKDQLKEKMVAALQDKQKKLEEEKNNLNLTDGLAAQSLRRRGKDAVQAQVTSRKKVTPPHINYTLKESEIMEDLAAIQKMYNSNNHGWKSAEGADIHVDDGILYYGDIAFEKGNSIKLQGDDVPFGAVTGVVVAVNPAEIHIKSADGVKKITLSQLRSGKLVLLSAA